MVVLKHFISQHPKALPLSLKHLTDRALKSKTRKTAEGGQASNSGP